tara:strand:- start:34 stop:804 length:771 start_codon:yes stop_codon:yes gene_type:complete
MPKPPKTIYTMEEAAIKKLLDIANRDSPSDPIVNPIAVGGGSEDSSLNKNAQLFINDSGETIPAYGCMQVNGTQIVDGGRTTLVRAVKPSGKGGPFLFNGGQEVEAGQLASGYTGEVQAKTEPSAAPSSGETWGPKEDWVVVSDGDPAILLWGSVKDEVYVGRTVTQGTSQLFVVELQHVGGEDGSSSAQCTWRYDISKVGNDEILKADDDIGLDPNKYRRINLGKYTQATHGIACFLEGELSVMTSNEVPVAGTC